MPTPARAKAMLLAISNIYKIKDILYKIFNSSYKTVAAPKFQATYFYGKPYGLWGTTLT